MGRGFAGAASVTAVDGSKVHVVSCWTSSENWAELDVVSPSGERSRIELDMEQTEQLTKGLLECLVGYGPGDWSCGTPLVGAKPLDEWMADEAARFARLGTHQGDD